MSFPIVGLNLIWNLISFTFEINHLKALVDNLLGSYRLIFSAKFGFLFLSGLLEENNSNYQIADKHIIKLVLFEKNLDKYKQKKEVFFGLMDMLGVNQQTSQKGKYSIHNINSFETSLY